MARSLRVVALLGSYALEQDPSQSHKVCRRDRCTFNRLWPPAQECRAGQGN